MAITIFDIILLSIICLSTFLGGYKGAVKITFSIIALVGSLFVADLISPYLESHLGKYIEHEVILSVVAMVVSFIIATIIFSMLVSRLASSVKIPGLLDNFLGLFLGFVRGVLISLIIFTTIIVFSSSSYINAKHAHDVVKKVDLDKYPMWLKESASFMYLHNLYHQIISMIPEDTLKSLKTPQTEEEEDLETIEKKAFKNKSNKLIKINDEFEIQEN